MQASQLLMAIAAYEEQLNGIQQLLEEGSTDAELIQVHGSKATCSTGMPPLSSYAL